MQAVTSFTAISEKRSATGLVLEVVRMRGRQKGQAAGPCPKRVRRVPTRIFPSSRPEITTGLVRRPPRTVAVAGLHALLAIAILAVDLEAAV